MKRWIWLLALTILTSAFESVPVLAAVRTIQFGGTGASFVSLIKKSRTNIQRTTDLSHVCGVIVTNTGSTTQRITSFKYYGFNPASGAVSTFTGGPGAIYNPSGSTTTAPSCGGALGATCLNRDIEPGGIFVSYTNVTAGTLGASAQLLNNEFIPCFGEFTVQDADPAQPGSSVATGFISYLSEMGILGGQFHGAVYMSGTHAHAGNPNLAQGPVMRGTTQTPRLLPLNWPGSMQMNLYCAQACQNVRDQNGLFLNADFCNTACGMEPGSVGNSDLSGEYAAVGEAANRNVLGFIEENGDGEWFGHSIRTSLPIPPGPSCQEMRLRTSDRFHVVESPQFQGLVRSANPHWAGGQVVEVILGPFDSICSGNEEYFTRGGSEFLHNETIDQDAGISVANTVNPNRGPPERLFCAHRHGQGYLGGYLTSGVQFPINGGMAF